MRCLVPLVAVALSSTLNADTPPNVVLIVSDDKDYKTVDTSDTFRKSL